MQKARHLSSSSYRSAQRFVLGSSIAALLLVSAAGCTSDPSVEIDSVDSSSSIVVSDDSVAFSSSDEFVVEAYCDPAANWPSNAANKEAELLTLINQVRSQGANCRSRGSFAPTGPINRDNALDCAARVHTQDMHDRNYFSHFTPPQGLAPWDRMELAGYIWRAAGENIAGGRSAAQATLDQWMASDGHCANIMGSFADIGVGHHVGSRLWTLVFGTRL